MPWQLVGGGDAAVQWGCPVQWDPRKVTVLAVFLTLQLVFGEVGTFKLSTWVSGCQVGDLEYATIPSLSKVA